MSKKEIETKVDGVLKWVRKQNYSSVIIAVFWFSGYLVGYYVGDIVHYLQDFAS